MNPSKKQVLAAYKRTSRSAEKVTLTKAERRVLRLLGLKDLQIEVKKKIINKCLNEAWIKHKKIPSN